MFVWEKKLPVWPNLYCVNCIPCCAFLVMCDICYKVVQLCNGYLLLDFCYVFINLRKLLYIANFNL